MRARTSAAQVGRPGHGAGEDLEGRRSGRGIGDGDFVADGAEGDGAGVGDSAGRR